MTANGFSVGNAFSPDAPPAHFRHFLVGDLTAWAQSRGPDAERIAAQFPVLSTDSVEVKIADEPSGKTGPENPDPERAPFSTTLSLVITGHMRIVLHSRSDNSSTTHDLRERSDFLAWAGSQYSHTWECVSDALVITVRWRET